MPAVAWEGATPLGVTRLNNAPPMLGQADGILINGEDVEVDEQGSPVPPALPQTHERTLLHPRPRSPPPARSALTGEPEDIKKDPRELSRFLFEPLWSLVAAQARARDHRMVWWNVVTRAAFL